MTRKENLTDKWCSRCHRKFIRHEYCQRCSLAVGHYAHPVKIGLFKEVEHFGGTELRNGLCDLCQATNN